MVVAYDPFSAEAMADPYPLYRELRDEAPVYRLERYDAWALSRFAEVWEVLEDRERFSIVEGPVFNRDRLLTRNPGPPARNTDPLTSFAMVDPPEHTHYRQAMHRAFTPAGRSASNPTSPRSSPPSSTPSRVVTTSTWSATTPVRCPRGDAALPGAARARRALVA